MNLKDKILKTVDVPQETVSVAEWGGVEILVKGMTAGQRGDWDVRVKRFSKDSDNLNFSIEAMIPLLIQCLYDPETGNHIFESGDCEVLAEKSFNVLAALFDKALFLSGKGMEAQKVIEGN
jgi:hypothetical protein